MARIIGGVGSAHAPSLGSAWDKGEQREPFWNDVFKGYEPARHWLEAQRPDLLVIFYNDHMNRFFFDAYPTFALGVAGRFPQADEGWGKRKLPDLRGDTDFGWHLARCLVEDEFDPTICQELSLDHGVLSVLPIFGEHAMTLPIVPIAVNVIQHPLPTARRLFRIGGAVWRAVEAYPKDLRVAVMGTGGLSHQLHGPRFGTVNTAWDSEFMDLLEREPETLAALPIETWMERGGTEGVEMIIWLAMRAALGDRVRRVHRAYAAPLLTGYGLLAMEPN